MANVKECESNDLQIAVKARRAPRFKAGADLSKSVNRVEVNVDQETFEDSEMISFEVKILNEACPPCN